MSQQTAPQTVNINPFQALQIAEGVLAQMKTFYEKKQEHPTERHRMNEDCIKSLHHSRLLVGLRFRELLVEYKQKEPQATATQPIVSQHTIDSLLDAYIQTGR